MLSDLQTEKRFTASTLVRSALFIALLAIPVLFVAQTKPRARDLGVPFDGKPGLYNAITDVKGVEVGHTTLISGSGKLKVGEGPVRTGVTAVLPRGKDSLDPVFGAWFTLNGNGEMTGTTWLEDSGFLDGPVMITNTHSVGVVRDAVIAWRVKKAPPDQAGYEWSLPVVAETYDGDLNDINGFHVKPEHAWHALDTAHGGAVEEGNVGGGTGMICNEFKGGIGTSSRVLDAKYGGYTVGVLVQCNYGWRSQLRIAGVPVGREIADHKVRDNDVGSIIVVVATDAPMIPTQLKRLARRVSLGLGRDGSYSGDGFGRHLRGLLNREPKRGQFEKHAPDHDASQRADEPAVSRDRAGDRRGGDQCNGSRRDHERHQRFRGDRPAS
jgi:D-aminopeptidase